MKILKTELELIASAPLAFFGGLAARLGATCYFIYDDGIVSFVRLITTFVSGDEIHAEHAIGKLVFCASDAALDDYAGYIKEKLIQQTCELMEDQIRDQLDPLEPFVDTGIRFNGQSLFLKTSGSRETDRQQKHKFTTLCNDPNPWNLYDCLS